jgi:hypothetical protein
LLVVYINKIMERKGVKRYHKISIR